MLCDLQNESSVQLFASWLSRASAGCVLLNILAPTRLLERVLCDEERWSDCGNDGRGGWRWRKVTAADGEL